MYEKILVPLDGSEVGEGALVHVENLVKKMLPSTNVEVTLIQVISEVTYDFITGADAAQLPYNEKDMARISQNATAYLEKAARGLKDMGITVNINVIFGHAAEQIIKTANEINADLIAMSSHGRSGLGRWALGSVTDKVLHQSNIPVLTVRAKHAVSKK
ncbi:MAG: universal stress protein [Dehalococcoidales bacterium]|nr:universal stress protein [Dehalococcoidales bacterium]